LTATVKTALVIVAARLLTIAIFGGLERMFRVAAENDGQHVSASEGWTGRAGRYYPLLRRLASWMVLVAALVAVLQAWGVDAFHWFRSGAVGGRLLSALAGALVAAIASIIAWEAANIALERRIDRLQHNPAGGAAKVARLHTLMPILRITLFIFIAVILIMTVLSEIGVNIAPLLGGAGILGVAIGFGSQKLVQDFITGIFLLLENAMQVGDSVTCAGLSGTVEHLSIRTLHLRSGDGSLQIIPFSSVTTLTNSNRGLGNTPISVDIAPDEDPDKVADILKQIVREMKADPAFGSGMLSELQYWGVDKVTRQAVTLVGQIVCTDGAHDGVRREFNRRMRLVFEARGIRLAQPVQAVQLIQLSESEQAPALPSTGEAQDRSAVMKDSPPTQALGHEA
jgi:small conductance mechanosensitive channel